MLDKVLDLFDEDDKRAFVSSEPIVQQWFDPGEGNGLSDGDAETVTEEETHSIRVCIRLTPNEFAELQQAARELKQ
jgi:hypothetical protein